jgi:hypothetical protein
MATTMQKEFDEGRLAALDGVARSNANCPYMATSDCADAWHAGHAYETRRPSVYGPSKVTSGRGYRVNVIDGVGYPKGGKAPRFVYRVDWNNGAPAPAVVVEGAL